MRCIWINGRCQHGYDIDDTNVKWSPLTKRSMCPSSIIAAHQSQTWSLR